MVFIFQFVNMYHIDLSVDIEESLHPWNKAYLFMIYDLFNMLLDSVSKNVLRTFESMCISDFILHFSFCVAFFSGFFYQGYGGHIE